MFSDQNDQVYQSTQLGTPAPLIGEEFLEAPWRQIPSDPDCPPTALCRYSDAVLFKYNDPSEGALGKIARPLWYAHGGRPFTLVRDTVDFQIHGDLQEAHFIQGIRLSKIGRTTGWTAGTLDVTCSRETVQQDRYHLCLDFVRDFMNTPDLSLGGDSGAPVIMAVESEDDPYNGLNWLAGIMNGGGHTTNPSVAFFTFHPLPMLVRDFGAMTTHTGPTCVPNPWFNGCQ